MGQKTVFVMLVFLDKNCERVKKNEKLSQKNKSSNINSNQSA